MVQRLGPLVVKLHSDEILTIQQGYPRGVSSVETPRPLSTGITLGEHLHGIPW